MCKTSNPQRTCPPPVNISSFNILSFNVEGLNSILDEPPFDTLLEKHDICLLTETWKSNDSKLNIEGFWDDSQVRPKHRKAFRHSGGVTVMVRHFLKPGIKVVQKMEGFVWLKLEKTFFGFTNDVYLCAAYIPPQYSCKNIHEKTDYFKSLFDSCLRFSCLGNIVITGDLNARVGNELSDELPHAEVIDGLLPDESTSFQSCLPNRSSCDNVSNSFGKKLIEICHGFNLYLANGRSPGDRLGNYTCFNNRGASVVDYVIADSGFFNSINKLVMLPPEFSSKHAPLSFSIKCNVTDGKTKMNLLPLPPKFIWDPLQASTFTKLLSQPESIIKLGNILKSVTENPSMGVGLLDKSTKDLSDLLYATGTRCLKLRNKLSSKVKPRRKKKQPWFNSSCSEVRKRFNNLARLLQKHPKDPHIVGKYMTVKKEYKTMLKDAKRTFEMNAIDKLTHMTKTPKSFWKHLKSITTPHRLLNQHLISPEVWIEHFSALNKSNPSDLGSQGTNVTGTLSAIQVMLLKNTPEFCNILDRKFDRDEILFGIKQLKNAKASGCDAISNEIIKISAPFIIDILCEIFNRLIESEHYPIQWATGLIMTLHKSGDFTDPNNYRGITINSCLSKLFTMLLNHRLVQYCELNSIIHYNQAGFRKGFRTADQVFTLKTIVDQSFSNGKKLYTCFVDFKKAYDMVWRDGLFYKLLKYNVSPKFVRLLRDMYSRLQACVLLPNGLSSPFPSKIGLKQGCNLSPLLFNIFINDLIDNLSDSDMDAPKLGELEVGCLLYADDLVLMSESEEGLQRGLDVLHKFTRDWHLQVNTTKTKCLTFHRGRRSNTPTSLKLGEILIQNCSTYCYLGTVFSESGSLKLAASTLSDKAKSAMFSLLKSLYKHKSCNVPLCMDLFDKMILPIATYNSEVWGVSCIPPNPNNNRLLDQDAVYKHPIEIFHCHFLKRLLGVRDRASNWAVISETGRKPITLSIFTSILKFLLHMKESPSEIVIAALEANKNIANINTWSKGVLKLLTFCNLSWECLTAPDINSTRDQLSNVFLEEWELKRDKLKVEGKLNLYAEIKGTFGREGYLDSKVYKYRNAVTKLRISAHRFPIETGRYSGIPREERLCPLCKSGVGNESHYLLECPIPKMVDARTAMLKYVSSEMPSMLNIDQKCKYILANNDPKQLNNVGVLCFKIQKIFKEEMKSIESPENKDHSGCL